MRASPIAASNGSAGGTVSGRPARATSEAPAIRRGRGRRRGFGVALTALFALCFAAPAAFGQAFTPPGVRISNVATVTYLHGEPAAAESNAVSVIVQALPSASALAILRSGEAGGISSTSGPSYCQGPGGMQPLPPPVLMDGTTLDPSQPASFAIADYLYASEPAFLELRDADRNLDAAVIDTVELELTTPEGDRERLRLSENGVNTGVFVGYLQMAAAVPVPGNCRLEVAVGSRIDARYVDADDAGDVSAASAAIGAFATDLYTQKSTATAIAAAGDFVAYTLTVENVADDDTVPDLRTVDTLPAGLRYQPGSTLVNGAGAADPEVSADGRSLAFRTGPLAPGARVTIRYVVEVTVAARGRRLVNAAQAFGPDGSGSNVAHATIQFTEDLFRRRAIVLGRVVEGDCATPAAGAPGVAGVRVYLEDGRYATTDVDGKYHFEDIAPGSHVVQLDTVTIPATHRALACADRVRHAGRAYSQFVDLRGGALWRADFVLERIAEAGGATAAAVEPAATNRKAFAPAAAPAIDVESLAPGTDWVLPAAGEVPAIPSIKVAIRHRPDERIELRVNGIPAHLLNFDGVTLNDAHSVALSRWRGIDLKDGDNRLLAVVRGADGAETARLERRIHYAGGAVRAELVREASQLVADGRTRPVIALRMTDTHGRTARPGTQGAWRVGAPYRSWWEVETLHENKLIAVGNREPTFGVDEDGLARLELEPTTQAGTATILLRFNERHAQEIRVWLEPAARDWILVGIAEGTAAYETISDNLQSAEAAGFEDGYSSDGRLAFFAKGVVKGEYLLTAAYDSDRDTGEAEHRLLGVVDPERFYTLYGDATEQRFEAASTEKLYLKIERRQFAALFGDYETGLTVTELARYSRTMNGFKVDSAGERFGYTVFAAESEQGFVRDELQGDGTSGLYRLTRRPPVINSDKLRIEVRDRFHSERVLESRPQTRYLDYDIDYLGGTVFFKRPVPSRDADFNPVIIVAEYEVLGGGDQQWTAGGRAALRSADDRVEVGASLIHEGAAAGDSGLAGLDLRWQIDEATRLRAEVAGSDSDDPARGDAGAWLAELVRVDGALDARVYAREQDEDFGVGQQMGSERGTRKFGADGRYRLGEHYLVEGEAWRQTMLASGAERDAVAVAVRRESADHALGAGMRHVADSGLANGDTESQVGYVSGRVDLLDDRVTLRATQEAALGGHDSSVDYPARSLVGIDYHWRPGSTLFAEYEHAEGANLDVDMTRVGLRTSPWARAQLQSSMTQEATEYGPRVFANLGLTQGWQVSERWGVDLGVDQSQTIRGPDLEPFNPQAPLASGTLADDFTSVFAGAQYRSELWTFTSRAETRQADAEDRVLLSAGFYREPVAGHAFSMATQLVDSDFATGVETQAETVQLSWAHRPADGEWIVLDRLDLKRFSQDDATSSLESSRIVNNLNANRLLDARTQLGLQFGGRYVKSSFDGERYSGFSALLGADLRRDLNARYDAGLHTTALRSFESGVSDFSVGVDVGMTVAQNIWISAGYNFTGFRDDDCSASRYTAQGLYIRFRVKADQDTVRDLRN
jgi:uncharacterized repeat protein (TIGR01451 family)